MVRSSNGTTTPCQAHVNTRGHTDVLVYSWCIYALVVYRSFARSLTYVLALDVSVPKLSGIPPNKPPVKERR